MSLSSMPTGTVSRDGAGSRTYPPDGIDNGPSETASSASAAPASSATSTNASTASSAPSSSPASATPSAQASTASQSRGRQQSRSRQQSRGRRPSPPADARGRDALQRENEALRRANARLNARLDSAETNQQEIIDRYERLLAERRDGSRKQTRGRSAPRNDRSRRSGVESNAADAVRSAVGRVVEGVASALGRR
ncbi:hypothetical protein [Haloferax volcanii]|uniref:Uncharacterized protein n=3 Tax=Haloferax volcanii TaxID=2246 RepID=A0A1C9J6X0_HALVD|nr:hypothetical protein [Haloferax volcanii]AOP12846.1 uncharacterized protein HVO_2968A [Haloferax volcanii DS2]MBS8118868.1 hypothetical protein [Haloferax volcanii]MBS8123882.1 hypothetical protein [Haloferax volcanii]MBS8127751.1 hypothetical protein [Haloferax volcanii]MBS8131616.1 hypothetical protein [Haloferax volcanii]